MTDFAGSFISNPTSIGDVRLIAIAESRGRVDYVDATTIQMPFGNKARSFDNTILATGVDSGAPPAVDTFYEVYWSLSGGSLVLAPNGSSALVNDGTYRLAFSLATQQDFLLVGWVQTIDDGAGLANFADDGARRYVASYWNRLWKPLFKCPGYADAGTQTNLAALNNAVYGRINGGNGDAVGYIANGFEAAELKASFVSNGALTAQCRVGIGDDSTTDPAVVAVLPNLALAFSGISVACSSAIAATWGLRRAYLLACTGGANVTFVADLTRTGSSFDPPVTFIAGMVAV